MKGIKIDSYAMGAIEVIGIKDYKDIQQVIGCSHFTVAHRFEYEGKFYTIFVDDEGLFNHRTMFYFEGAHQPFFGDGLILQDLPDGESGDADIPLEYINEKVTYSYYISPKEQEIYNERWGIV